MEPLLILRADPLDLLFENRNKAYGAYLLRKYYAQRLFTSLGIVLSAVVVLSFFYLRFRDKTVVRKMPDILTEVVLCPVDPFPPVKPLPPTSTPSALKPPAAVEFVTPLIVPDARTTRTMASIEDLAIHAIGLVATPGEISGDQPSANGNGLGTAVKSTDSADSGPEIFDHPEQMPEFPGGPEGLKRFLQKNLRMPENNLETGQQIKVVARFVVGPDGRVSNIELNQGTDEIFNSEVRRVILKMPEWKPGMQHNRNVAVYFSLPVSFVAEE